MSTLTRIHHTYADTKLFREYIEGSREADEWTGDRRVVRLLLEAVSDTIRGYVGQCFGPRVETHEYDFGTGRARSSAEWPEGRDIPRPDYWPGAGGRIIELDEWLVSASTVTAYDDTARSGNTVLTEGVGNDFFLEPYNENPKRFLKLNEDTTNELNVGQKTITILGTWGWWNETESVTAVSGSWSDSVTQAAVADASGLSAGMTILVGSEQIYVTAVEANTLTMIRGVNGTTAASHSNPDVVYKQVYPSDVAEITLAIARNRWREREAGTSEYVGVGDNLIIRPGAEEIALLKRLDDYRGRQVAGGVSI